MKGSFGSSPVRNSRQFRLAAAVVHAQLQVLRIPRQQRVSGSGRVDAAACPRIFPRLCYQPCLQRVSLDVSTATQKIRLALDRRTPSIVPVNAMRATQKPPGQHNELDAGGDGGINSLNKEERRNRRIQRPTARPSPHCQSLQ
jgi:hypothetical protein